jgi:lipopolysaccharide transport system permease protein
MTADHLPKKLGEAYSPYLRGEAEPEELIIEAGRRENHYWQDIWRYRELFRVLAWRDVAVRYKQTALGAAWSILRPFITMIVFTVIFGKIANLPSQGAPYSLLVFAGLLPWTLFSTALSDASNSLVVNAHLIGKIYFPRLIIPGAAAIVSLVDFLISLLILVGLMIWYQYFPGWRIIFLPFFVFMTLAATSGLSLWIAALNVKYRDFRYVMPFLLQIGVYVSPVGFSSRIVPEQWRLPFYLNPLAGAIDGFRWCILHTSDGLYFPGLVLSVTIICLLMWFGLWQFRKMENTFADII